MAAGNSVHDEIREQQQKAKEMTVKGKLAYFWDYYKIHTIAVVLAIVLVISFIRQYLANKPYAFYAVLLNAASTAENSDTSVIWGNEFQEFAGIDPEAYQVYFDTSLSLSADGSSQYEAANRQKVAALMHAGSIHAIVADTETFESYARAESFCDLSAIFTEEELAPYAALLYYTDTAAIDEENASSLEELEAAQMAYYAKTVDHSDPSAMKNPVAVGIRIPASENKLAEAGYYRYLLEENDRFQGYPSETVIGIPLSAEDPNMALQFLSFLDIH